MLQLPSKAASRARHLVAHAPVMLNESSKPKLPSFFNPLLRGTDVGTAGQLSLRNSTTAGSKNAVSPRTSINPSGDPMADTWTAGSGSAFTLNPLTHRPHGLTHSGVPYDSPCSSSRSSPRQRQHQGSPQQHQQQGSPLSDGRSSSSMQKESDRAIALQLQREEELALESAAALDATGSGGASVAPAARQRTDSEFARQLHEEEKRMLASEQQGQGHQGVPGVLGRMSAPGQSTGQGTSPFSHPFQQQGPGQVQGGGASKVAKPGKAGKEKGGMFGMRMPDLHLRDKGELTCHHSGGHQGVMQA